MQEFEADDPHFQHVAGLGALDENRTGERMRARPAFGDRLLDDLQRLGNLLVFHAGRAQPRQPARQHRFDANRVARRDGQHRFHRRVVVAPVHVPGQQPQVVRL